MCVCSYDVGRYVASNFARQAEFGNRTSLALFVKNNSTNDEIMLRVYRNTVWLEIIWRGNDGMWKKLHDRITAF